MPLQGKSLFDEGTGRRNSLTDYQEMYHKNAEKGVSPNRPDSVRFRDLHFT